MFLLGATVFAGKVQQKLSRELTLRIGVILHAIACLAFIGLDFIDVK